MAPLAQQTMESDLARLRAQRERYVLALSSSSDDRAQLRHVRTIERLDEEIAALEEALLTLSAEVPVTPRPRDPFGVPVVERTVELDPDAFDDNVFAAQAAATRTRNVAIGVGAVVIGGLLVVWALARPTPPPAPTPAPATTPSVVVSSPVPPDPDDAPAKSR